MIHFVRTQNNENLVDIETTKDDINSAIDIEVYSNLLLYLFENCRIDIVSKFIQLLGFTSEVRAYYFEANHDHETTDDLAEFVCNWIIREFPELELSYTTD